jgi:hypothetical protein
MFHLSWIQRHCYNVNRIGGATLRTENNECTSCSVKLHSTHWRCFKNAVQLNGHLYFMSCDVLKFSTMNRQKIYESKHKPPFFSKCYGSPVKRNETGSTCSINRIYNSYNTKFQLEIPKERKRGKELRFSANIILTSILEYLGKRIWLDSSGSSVGSWENKNELSGLKNSGVFLDCLRD